MIDEAYSGRFEGKTHILPARVYYEDTDMSGVVYHANYLRYFERGRSDFLRTAGVVHTELAGRDRPLAFAVIGMDIKFKKAARIDNSLLIQTEYNSLEGIRFHIHQKITRQNEKGGQDIICTAKVEVVVIDFQGNPQRPPKEMVESLGEYFV